jgi:hypothetical protein
MRMALRSAVLVSALAAGVIAATGGVAGTAGALIAAVLAGDRDIMIAAADPRRRARERRPGLMAWRLPLDWPAQS